MIRKSFSLDLYVANARNEKILDSITSVVANLKGTIL